MGRTVSAQVSLVYSLKVVSAIRSGHTHAKNVLVFEFVRLYARPAMREAARRRALAAMAEAVGERGYVETTVRDVLERARMSRRTFYELFDNREQCFLAAYDQAHSDLMLQLEHPRGPDEPWPDHVTVVVRDLLEFLAAAPDTARLLVVEPVSVGPPGLERHERTMREFADRLAHSQAASLGVQAEQLRLRCEASVGALHRVVHARIVQGRTSELPELAPELVSLMGELAPAS
jgi:AcrR family transcriptional regulator